MDFAKLKQTNDRLEAEKDNLNDETKETQLQKENMEEEQRKLRKEVKDYKVKILANPVELLVACTRLNKPLCRSVCRSVRPSLKTRST